MTFIVQFIPGPSGDMVYDLHTTFVLRSCTARSTAMVTNDPNRGSTYATLRIYNGLPVNRCLMNRITSLADNLGEGDDTAIYSPAWPTN